MEIGFGNVNRMPPPQVTEVGEVASRRLPEDDAVRFQAAGRRFPGEIAQVSGEEAVDEAALDRDDSLGKLVSKAFDAATATAALPPLEL